MYAVFVLFGCSSYDDCLKVLIIQYSHLSETKAQVSIAIQNVWSKD